MQHLPMSRMLATVSWVFTAVWAIKADPSLVRFALYSPIFFFACGPMLLNVRLTDATYHHEYPCKKDMTSKDVRRLEDA